MFLRGSPIPLRDSFFRSQHTVNDCEPQVSRTPFRNPSTASIPQSKLSTSVMGSTMVSFRGAKWSSLLKPRHVCIFFAGASCCFVGREEGGTAKHCSRVLLFFVEGGGVVFSLFSEKPRRQSNKLTHTHTFVRAHFAMTCFSNGAPWKLRHVPGSHALGVPLALHVCPSPKGTLEDIAIHRPIWSVENDSQRLFLTSQAVLSDRNAERSRHSVCASGGPMYKPLDVLYHSNVKGSTPLHSRFEAPGSPPGADGKIDAHFAQLLRTRPMM